MYLTATFEIGWLSIKSSFYDSTTRHQLVFDNCDKLYQAAYKVYRTKYFLNEKKEEVSQFERIHICFFNWVGTFTAFIKTILLSVKPQATTYFVTISYNK